MSNSSQKLLKEILTKGKSFHLNFYKERYYKVSLGSLLLDYETGGGLMPGLHRFCGSSFNGKTSEAFEAMRNFFNQEDFPYERRGFLVKAEGRLDPALRQRTGLDFVFDSDSWDNNTCFVLETNIYEFAFSTIRNLIENNKDNICYFFIIDSMDALAKKDDIDKGFDKASFSGGAKLTSDFLQRVSLKMAKFGHLCILISQAREEVKIDPYQSLVPKLTKASGGHAPSHYSNFLFEFMPHRSKDDLIRKGDVAGGEIIGHYAKVKILKNVQEKSNFIIKYPVIYGKKNGSIWLEKELVDALFMWELVTKKGTWFSFSEEIAEDLNKLGCKQDSFQGKQSLFNLIESDKKIRNFLLEEVKKRNEIGCET